MRNVALLASLILVGAASAQTDDTARLKSLEKAYLTAKANLAKKPKDAAAKSAFVKAGTQFGHESMVSPVLPAKVKYRQALRVYREVLKISPKQPVARPEYDLIVSIYKQMGRPVPQ